jgi:acetolactate synthase I/II/III large subunit
VSTTEQGHGGLAAARALTALGVKHVFALSGGHIFPLLDGCHREGIRIVDVRHEATAGYAAEGWARLTRSIGVAVVTAGPGVTNLMSPLVQASFNRAPMLALAGRAPAFRWGQGSLQEIDHVTFVGPVAPAKTVADTGRIAAEVVEAATAASTPPRGPVFLDFPLESLFGSAELEVSEQPAAGPAPNEARAAEVVGDLIAEASRPVIVAGSNVWLDGADQALRALVEKTQIPVYMNGGGRGCVPADHRLAFSRSRSFALRHADLVIVMGAPLDFRLGFGDFAAARVVHMDSAEESIAHHVDLAASIGAPLDGSLPMVMEATSKRTATEDWIRALRSEERSRDDAAQRDLRSDARPIHPMRIYGELVPLLERDAVVIGDGGDFVSFAGREVRSYEPGRWLDPGPFGCLGCGAGYAIAARLAHPDSHVVLLSGDGALGFAGMDLETLVRHRLPVVCVVGNNGIWGLEKHPMRAIYGYDVAADLRLETRYDHLMESFGGRGELVEDASEIAPALKRAFDSADPYLINVVTDADVAYPRSTVLA